MKLEEFEEGDIVFDQGVYTSIDTENRDIIELVIKEFNINKTVDLQLLSESKFGDYITPLNSWENSDFVLVSSLFRGEIPPYRGGI